MQAEDRGLPTAMLYCQVSFGIGHWVKMAALLGELRHRFRVVLLLDGDLSDDLTLPDGIEVVRILSGASSGTDGRQLRRQRRLQLADVARRVQPDVLVIEYFPFGRQERFIELLQLLYEATTNLTIRPVIVSSLRDINQRLREGQQSFDARACDVCNRYFDAVLVHADPTFARFEETFQSAGQLQVPVIYTGFIVPADEITVQPDPEPVVLVSAGGGLGGEGLLRLAVESMRTTDLSSQFRMRMIAGMFQTDAVWTELQRKAAGVAELTLLRWVPNLRIELQRASVSVSRCGYNTALDLMRTSTPALVVPFSTEHEDEQTLRARKLEGLGALRVLPESDATPTKFSAEVRRTARFNPRALGLDMNGARRSVEAIESLLAAARRERGRQSPGRTPSR